MTVTLNYFSEWNRFLQPVLGTSPSLSIVVLYFIATTETGYVPLSKYLTAARM